MRMKQVDTGTAVCKVYGEVADICDLEVVQKLDLSRLHARSRNAVIRYLNQGFANTYRGKASTVYRALVRRYGIPQGRVRAHMNAVTQKLNWTVEIIAPKDTQRDELEAFLMVSLPNAKQHRWYYTGNNNQRALYLHGTAPPVTGDTHPETVFNMAFNASYGEEIKDLREKAIRTLENGETLYSKIEV